MPKHQLKYVFQTKWTASSFKACECDINNDLMNDL